MVDAIISLFMLAGYLILGLIGIFVVLWLMVCAYVVAYDVTHKNEWKNAKDDNEEQWL